MRSTTDTIHLRAAFDGARALVTGGAGFIAGHLAIQLRELGAHVLLVDERPIASSELWCQRLAHLPSRQVATRQARVGTPGFGRFYDDEAPFDYIFHLAGRAYAAGSVTTPELDFGANLAATLDLLELLRARSVTSKLLFASSAAVYGNPVKIPIEEGDITEPVSPYGVSKLAAERYIAVYARLYGLRAASLRLFSVYGPYQTKQVVFDFFQKLQDTPERITVIGDGSQARDMVFVEDVARAFLTGAAFGRDDGTVYNVATGSAASTAELAAMVIEAQESDAAVGFTGVARPGDPERWLGSSARLQAIGWQPQTSLREGLHITAEWFNTHVSAGAREVGVA